MGLEFKYGDGKVLGTQPHPTYGLASNHCVLRLNLIEGLFNIVIYTHTHTHTSIHLVINMTSIIQKPYHTSIMATHIKLNIHLSCISYYLIQGSKQIKISHGHDSIKQLLESIKNIKNTNIFQVHISYSSNLNKIISQSNACTYECISYLTYLTASQYLCINV